MLFSAALIILNYFFNNAGRHYNNDYCNIKTRQILSGLFFKTAEFYQKHKLSITED